MSDYAKIEVRGVYSRNSDYSDPEQNTRTLRMALTPDECIHRIVDAPITTGIDILALDEFTTVTAVLVRNNDSTNFVTMTGQDAGSTAFSVKIPAGNVCLIPGVDIATATGAAVNLTADTAACECEVFITGT